MLTRLKIILLLAGFKMCCITGLIADCSGDPINLIFNLDSCDAHGAIAPTDYSEFVPIITESTGVKMSMVSNSLYRKNPTQNRHSCTPGRNGSTAMCISAYEFCNYQPGNYVSVFFDVEVTALTDESARLSEFSFYQMAPEMYQWANGPTGVNNYPLFYGVRILRDGITILQESELLTARTWTQSSYDFSDNDDFKVRNSAIFTIELQAYCPIGIFSPYHVWDLEDISLTAICETTCDDLIDGGTVSLDNDLTEIVMCNQVSSITVKNTSGTSPMNYQYVLTDAQGLILNTFSSISTNEIAFDNLPSGTYYVYGLSASTGIQPAVGTPISSIVTSECESLSTNFITITRNIVEPGVLTGGPFRFCVGNGEPDIIPDDAITLTGAVGENMQWVVTDVTGTIILALPDNISDIDFDNSDIGDCVIWNVSFTGVVDDLVVNEPFTCIANCMKRSNSVTVQRRSTSGGLLTADPVTICVGDGVDNGLLAGSVSLEGNVGTDSRWIFTTPSGEILFISDEYTSPGILSQYNESTLLWHISMEGAVGNFFMGSNISDLDGCYSLSNSFTIEKELVQGGTLHGGPFSFCVGDGEPDYLPVGAIELTDNIGLINQWVVTDVTGGEILALPNDPSEVNFESMLPGTCDLWNISYNETPDGLVVGGSFPTLRGCLARSNFIPVYRYRNTAGTLTGGPFMFCVNDNVPDYIPDGALTISGQTGANEFYLITDSNDIILNIPANYSDYNFDRGAIENYKVYHLTYDGILNNLAMGSSVFDLDGCYSLSDPIIISRSDCNQPIAGGTLMGGPYTFCLDGQSDFITNLVLINNLGTNSQWVITDPQGIIQDLPADISLVDFEQVLAGRCLIYNLSYEPGLQGLTIGNDLDNALTGIYALSNPVDVYKGSPIGGTITGGPFEFCPGIGGTTFLDVGSIQLIGHTASNSAWIITDANGTEIIAVVDNPEDYDFNSSGSETNLIWHLSFEGVLSGLMAGEQVSNLTGCYGISNSIIINKTGLSGATIEGGPFEFCPGNGADNFIDAGSIQLIGHTASNSAWLITDANGTEIIAVVDNPEDYDFNNSGSETNLIWHVGFEGVLTGLMAGEQVSNLQGCYGLSNSLDINKTGLTGATIEGGPFEFCTENGESDYLDSGSIQLIGQTTSNGVWIITDATASEIIAVIDNPEDYDFDNSGSGSNLIWHVSYEGALTGLMAGEQVSNLSGCYGLSNSISINKTNAGGGAIEGGPFWFCIGDGVPDTIPAGAVTLNGNTGLNQQWVVTNTAGTEVLALPEAPEDVDFDTYPAENCLLWSISYDQANSGLEIGSPFNELDGCIARSNFLTLFKVENSGGTISTNETFVFCVGDGVKDTIPENAIELNGNTGGNSQWVLTDDNGIILNLPFGSYSIIDLDGYNPGVCHLYHMSYDGPLTGFGMNMPLAEVGGCYTLSNSLPIAKNACVINNNIRIHELDPDSSLIFRNGSDEGINLVGFSLYIDGIYTDVSELTPKCGATTMFLPAGESIMVNHNQPISNEGGEVALMKYTSNQNEMQILQYVAWGDMDKEMEKVAVENGLWMDGESVAALDTGMALIYDGDGISAADWNSGPPQSCLTRTEQSSLEEFTFKVYPNPVTDLLVVELQDYNQEGLRVELINNLGQVVLRQKVVSYNKTIILKTHDLIPSVYTVRLSDGTRSSEHRIIKQ